MRISSSESPLDRRILFITSKILKDGGVLYWCVIYTDDYLWVFFIYTPLIENQPLCFRDVNL